jgi:sialidase-1
MTSYSYSVPPVTFGLITHLDGTSITVDESNIVVSWDDLSGNGASAVAIGGSGSAPQMVSATINGTIHNAVRFDGVDDYLQIAANSAYNDLTGVTSFIVARAAVPTSSGDMALCAINTSTHFFIYGYGQYNGQIQVKSRKSTGSQTLVGLGANTYANTYWIAEGSRLGSTLKGWYNGSLKGTVTDAAMAWGTHRRILIGALSNHATNPPNGNFSNVEIAEIIIYNRALSDSERNAVGYYLAQKYNITSSYTDPGPARTLTIATNPGVIPDEFTTPGVGVYECPNGAIVEIKAADSYADCPDVYAFSHWTVADANNIAVDITSASATILMDSDKNITANYIDLRACGDQCHPIPIGDFDNDCKVTFADYMLFAQNWLVSTKPDSNREPYLSQETLFMNTPGCYYRIPSIVVTENNTVLAFCNRRVGSVADFVPEQNLVLRRSVDGGQSWLTIQELSSLSGWAATIGSAVLDENTGKIMIIYSRYPQTEDAIALNQIQNLPTGRFIAYSTDDGVSWTHQKINLSANSRGGVGGCHGSAPGVTLKYGQHKGRLLIPARYGPSEEGLTGDALYELLQTQHYNCALYSDNHGLTWQTSEPVQVGTGEGCLAEMSDGTIYYNSRAFFLDYKRRLAYSYNGGETFQNFSIDNTLLEPAGGCNAGLVRYPFARSNGKYIFLFSNPANHLVPRTEMTVRISYDEGRTWPLGRILHQKFAAYSALAVGRDGTIYCLYECGVSGYEQIKIAIFNLEWITQQ